MTEVTDFCRSESLFCTYNEWLDCHCDSLFQCSSVLYWWAWNLQRPDSEIAIRMAFNDSGAETLNITGELGRECWSILRPKNYGYCSTFAVFSWWLIYPYPSGLVYWQGANRIALVPIKHHWKFWFKAHMNPSRIFKLRFQISYAQLNFLWHWKQKDVILTTLSSLVAP